MRRVFHDHRNLVIALWVVAGALLLGRHEPVAAQGAVSISAFTEASAPDRPAGLAVPMVMTDAGIAALGQITGAEVEQGLPSGGGSYALGALVGAVVAAVAALRERFTKR